MSNVNEKAERKAKKLGLDLVLPNNNELFVDLDSKLAAEKFDLNVSMLRGIIGIEKLEFTLSKSGWVHAYVTVSREMNVTERIAYQAILGSDPIREALAMRQVLNNIENPVCFFEVPNRIKADGFSANVFLEANSDILVMPQLVAAAPAEVINLDFEIKGA